MRNTWLSCGLLAAAIGMGLTACNNKTKTETEKTTHEHTHSHGGGHSHDGLHGGEAVPLSTGEAGEEHAYHAELTHDDDTETVSIYILDVKRDVPIAVDTVKLMLNVGKETPTFLFTAKDPRDGKSSRFDCTEKKLFELIEGEHEEANGQIVVEIDGKMYSGKIKELHHEE